MKKLFKDLTPNTEVEMEYKDNCTTPFRSVEKDNEFNSKMEFNFDDHGNISKIDFGDHSNEYKNEYWDNGNLKSIKCDNSTESFDEQGRSLTVSFDNDGNTITPIISKYNDETNEEVHWNLGNEYTSRRYDLNDNQYTVLTQNTTTDEDKQFSKRGLFKTRVNNANGTYSIFNNEVFPQGQNIIENIYDKDGNEIAHSKYSLNNTIMNKYDEHNNLAYQDTIEIDKSNCGKYTKSFSTKFTNKYDEQGRLINTMSYFEKNGDEIDGWYENGENLLDDYLNLFK